MTTKHEIRGEFFMAIAPVYLITSNYLMQTALKQTSMDFTKVLFLVLSIVFMVLAFWLGVVAFLKRPKKAAEFTYALCTSYFFVVITALVFVLGWLGTTLDLLKLSPNEAYIISYLVIGLLIYLAVIVFAIYDSIKREFRKKKGA